MKADIMTNSTANLSRRSALVLGGAAAVLGLSPLGAFANAGTWQRVDEVLAVLDGADPIAQGMVLDLPMVSENGASVQVNLSVDRPMAEGEYVESIHLFAPGNPYPEIAAYRFTPLSGRPAIETRIRLNETQTVIALAKLSNGAVLVGEQEVRVTTSGCLTDADTYDTANEFQTRVRAPEALASGDIGEVLTIINHPQESGLRTDASGEAVPMRLIERFEATLDGEPVFSADLHRSVATNPYIKFFIAPQAGGTLELVWTEDTGESAQASAEIAVS